MDHGLEDAHDDRTDLVIYLSLLGLTALTLGASFLGEGKLMAVAIAFIVATAKAALIGFYYMGLRREDPLTYVILGIGATAVMILFLGIMPDLTAYPR